MRDEDPALVWYGGLNSIAYVAGSVRNAASWGDLASQDLHYQRESLVYALDALTWLLERELRVAESEALLESVTQCIRLLDARRLDDLCAEAAELGREIILLGYVRNAWPGEDRCVGYPDGGMPHVWSEADGVRSRCNTCSEDSPPQQDEESARRWHAVHVASRHS